MRLIKLCLYAIILLSVNSYANISDPVKLSTLSDKVDINNYINDMQQLAIPRVPGSKNHALIRQYIIDRLKNLEYQVELHNYGTGTNIIGRKIGSKLPNEEVIVSAHYDSTNQWCDIECQGADDNASGVASVLEIARVLADQNFDRTLTLAFWDEEELGYLGSKAYAARYVNQKMNTRIMFSFDVIGFASHVENSQRIPFGLGLFFTEQVKQIKVNLYKGNFIAIALDDSDTAKLANNLIINEGNRVDLPVVSFMLSKWKRTTFLLRDFRRSDHSIFWDYNLPAVGISDTANFRNPNYHCENNNQDSLDTIDYDFATKVTKVITYATAGLL